MELLVSFIIKCSSFVFSPVAPTVSEMQSCELYSIILLYIYDSLYN